MSPAFLAVEGLQRGAKFGLRCLGFCPSCLWCVWVVPFRRSGRGKESSSLDCFSLFSLGSIHIPGLEQSTYNQSPLICCKSLQESRCKNVRVCHSSVPKASDSLLLPAQHVGAGCQVSLQVLAISPSPIIMRYRPTAVGKFPWAAGLDDSGSPSTGGGAGIG